MEEIFQTTMDAIKEKKLDAAIQELKNMTPAPMNTMLEKQPRQEVLQKRDDRRRMSCNDVPPTTPGTCTLQLKMHRDGYLCIPKFVNSFIGFSQNNYYNHGGV